MTTPTPAGAAAPLATGGEPASSARYDAVALVESGGSSCTGTLIASTWLLTAGHCVKGHGIVRGGPRAISDPDWTSAAVGTAHPQAMRGASGRTDVGMFELADPTRVTASFDLRTNDLEPGALVEIVGWGTTDDGARPSELTRAWLEVREPTECRDHFIAGSFDEKRMLCLHADGRSACHGDSGGPVLAGSDLVGIVTYATPGCARYTVALRSDAIQEWIGTTIRAEEMRSTRTRRGSTTAADSIVEDWPRRETVVLAAMSSPGDQAVASALAAKLASPLLLSDQRSLPSTTAAALDRMRPREVLVVGGTGAIGDVVTRDLSRRGIEVRRLAGPSAHETAVTVSRESNPRGTRVAVVTASTEVREWTLAAAAAALHDGPVFVLRRGAERGPVLSEIERLGVHRIHVVGAIDDETMRVLREIADVTHVNQGQFSERALAVWNTTDRPRSDVALVPRSEVSAAFVLVPLVAIGAGTSIFVVPDRCAPTGVLEAIERSHPPVVMLVDPLPAHDSLPARC